jgi:predicted lipid-binding transport protein (Tim44 family)
MAFFLVKKAWQDLDVHAGRSYLTPDLFQSWSGSVEEIRSQQLKPVLENLNVQGLWVIAAERGETRDVIDVHFDVVAAPHYVNPTTGQVVSGSTSDERAGEEWRFERDSGTLTVVSGGVTAQKCPSCGAPLQLDEVGQCRYCRADVTSGKFDWVVTAMEQAEFEGGGVAAPAQVAESPEEGIARIRAADPAFEPQAFLNRAHQGFMALEQCWMDRNLDEGRVYMSPGLYMSWSAQVQQLIQLHKKNILENLRVTNMQIARVGHSDGFDNVTVRVDAICADYEVDEGTGKVIFGSKHESPFAEYWTFQRSTAAQTKDGGIIEKVCPNCGAPLQINQVGECQYCKAGVTSGQFDWVLSRIDQENEWR